MKKMAESSNEIESTGHKPDGPEQCLAGIEFCKQKIEEYKQLLKILEAEYAGYLSQTD